MSKNKLDVKSKLGLMICAELHRLRTQDIPHPSWTQGEIMEALSIVKTLLLDIPLTNDNK